MYNIKNIYKDNTLAVVLFLVKSLIFIKIALADHGQEVSITLDSAQFIPLTT
jgi:hypothetical protein